MPVLTRRTLGDSWQIYTGTLQPEKTRDSEGFTPLPGRKTEYTSWSNLRISPHSDIEQPPGTGWGVNRGLTAAVRSKHARTLKDVQVPRNCDVLCEKFCPTPSRRNLNWRVFCPGDCASRKRTATQREPNG